MKKSLFLLLPLLGLCGCDKQQNVTTINILKYSKFSISYKTTNDAPSVVVSYLKEAEFEESYSYYKETNIYSYKIFELKIYDTYFSTHRVRKEFDGSSTDITRIYDRNYYYFYVSE